MSQTIYKNRTDAELLEWASSLRGTQAPKEVVDNPRATLDILAEEGLDNEKFRRLSLKQKHKAIGRVKRKLRERQAKIEESLTQNTQKMDALWAEDEALSRLDKLQGPIFGRSRTNEIEMPITSGMMRRAKHGPAYPGASDIMTEVTFDMSGAGSEYARYALEDLKDVAYRFMGGMRLEKPQGMSFHHFIDYLETVWPSSQSIQDEDFWALLREQRSFVVEHDWHRAFEQGTGFTGGGEVRLPYKCTCFEFRISGVRVLVLTSESDSGAIWTWLALGINRRWYLDPKARILEGDRLVLKMSNQSLEAIVRGTPYAMSEVGERLAEFVARQIRACCIVLDSGIAIASPQAQSPKLNARRQAAGRSVLKPYHVVSLAPKYRERSEPQGGTHASPRFHWRRGHYKHYREAGSGREQYVDAEGYTRSRTWVNWMPVNLHRLEDLGFVDKHYKL